MEKFLFILSILFVQYFPVISRDASGTGNKHLPADTVLQYGDVIINEIFADPNPVIMLPPFEFIELYNRSNRSIDLLNWVFSDGTAQSKIKSTFIHPHEYLILCKASDSNAFKPYGKTSGLTSWPSLNNAGDFLTLKDPGGQLIFEVKYSDQWYKDNRKRAGGYTLEMINPYSLCRDLYNWEASADISGGTPGKVNSIYNSMSDTLIAKFSSVESPNDSTLVLSFNTLLDTAGLLIPANYFIYNEIYYPKRVSIEDATFKKIRLVLVNKLRPGLNYKIDVNNQSDCKGLPLQYPYNSLYYFYPGIDDSLSRIRINELFPDPSPEVGLPLREYIELYNCESRDVDLSGWSISDPSGKSVFPNYVIPAKSYVIICNISDTALYKPFGSVLGLKTLPSLNNSSDSIRLKNKADRLIHDVNYSLTWYRNPVKSQGGWSLENINPYEDCHEMINWTAAISSIGGTPGTKNSVFRDTTGFELLDFKVKEKRIIELYFNRGIDQDILHPHCFYVYDKALNLYFPTQLQSDSPYHTIIRLTYNTFSPGNYQLVINAIGSCGKYDTTILTRFSIAHAPNYPLFINELMIDPEPVIDLPDAEYIELYNASDTILNIDKLRLRDDKGYCTFGKGNVAAKGYILLCDKDDSAKLAGYGPVLTTGNFISLNNISDVIILEDEDGNMLDRVAYTSQWYRSSEKAKGGYSLERIQTVASCAGASNWIASMDASGGTPGRINSANEKIVDSSIFTLLDFSLHKDSVFLIFNKELDTSSISDNRFRLNKELFVSTVLFDPQSNKRLVLVLNDSLKHTLLYELSLIQIPACHPEYLDTTLTLLISKKPQYNDLILNEILFNPYPGGVDFIELYNPSNFIFDLREFSFSNDTSLKKQKFISDKSLLFHPRTYKVFCLSKEGIEAFYYVRYSENLHKTANIPGMNDAEGRIFLIYNQQLIDAFTYSEKMHHSFIADKEGVSLERKSFATNSHWTSASSFVGYASPTYENSQYRNEEIQSGNFYTEPRIFSPSRSEQTRIHYELGDSDYLLSIRIYNTDGRLVKTLVNDELAGVRGDYFWDGDSEQGIVEPGIYIIHIASFRPGEKEQHQKMTLIVAP